MTPASQDRIFSVRRIASVAEATSVMNEAQIGSVVVTDDWECVRFYFIHRPMTSNAFYWNFIRVQGQKGTIALKAIYKRFVAMGD